MKHVQHELGRTTLSAISLQRRLQHLGLRIYLLEPKRRLPNFAPTHIAINTEVNTDFG